MKKLYLLLVGLLMAIGLYAQVQKTIENTAGQLGSLLTTEELNSITSLTITGTMDARDFKTIRFNLPNLQQIDISQVAVMAFTETQQTGGPIDYEANVIPEMSFYNKDFLVSVLLPSTITKINNRAFESCDALTSITLPDAVRALGNGVFFECQALTTVTLSSSLQSIGSGIFYNCYALTSVNIPSSVTSIGTYAFYFCEKLTEIEIPTGVTVIEMGTFEGCSSLKSVTIPSSVSAIGSYAFFRCSSLTGIEIPSSITKIETSTFNGCSSLTSVTLPAGLTSIGSYAFSGNSALTAINIPPTVTAIGDNAFSYCSSLLTINLPSVTMIDSRVFKGCSALSSITIPSSVTSIGDEAFAGCSSLTAVSIPSSVTAIGKSSFEQCEKMDTLVIPASVSSIGQFAFSSCSQLSTIYSLRSVPVVNPSGIFNNIDKSKCTLHVPYGSEANYAAAAEWKDFKIVADASGFSLSASSIKFDAGGGEFQLTISATMGWTVVSESPWLTISPLSGNANGTLTVTAKANDTQAYRFADITVTPAEGEAQVVRVTQKSSPIVIPMTAGDLGMILTKEELDTITSLTLTGTINARDIYVIGSMPLLRMLDISQTRIIGTTIENVPFADDWFPGPSVDKNPMNMGGISNPLLRTIKLPSTLKVIGSGAFQGCGFTSFTFPPSVTTVGFEAFAGCNSLESITIPSTVTRMDQWVFSACKGLKEVIIEDGLEIIARGTFAGCSILSSVTLPASIKDIGMDAFWESPSLATIYSYNPVPPYTEHSFNSADKSTCIVYVPYGSKDAYAQAEEWKEFTHIVEMTGMELSATSFTIEAVPDIQTINITTLGGWSAVSDKEWLTLSPASGDSTQTITITALENTAYESRTATITFSAANGYSQTVTVTQHGLVTGMNQPASPIVLTCYPNPFTAEMSIEIINPSLKEVNVDIYSISGQKIRSLAKAQKGAKITLGWNGRDEQGQQLSNGFYLLKVNNQAIKIMMEKR